MTEEFLHYLWRFRLINTDLTTITGDSLTIQHPGELNRDSGPDFFNARIRVGGTVWAGNVEIHLQSSDWYRHKHQNDPAYDNVILHVVYENDIPVADIHGKFYPTLVLKGNFPESILHRYGDFLKNQRWIACEHLIGGLDVFHFNQWAPALALEHQSGKMQRFQDCLVSCNYDWDECFHRQLFRAFGFRINSAPFELLAKSVPAGIIRKYSSHLFQLEAILFGQSGLIPDKEIEDYPKLLLKEYKYIREKHSLDPLPPGLWKFLRLRPSNFPTIRIAQLAALIHRQEDLFSIVLKSDSVEKIRNFLLIRTSEYWSTHFLFNRLSPEKQKVMGIASADLLVLNLIIPFLFFYGEMKNVGSHKEKALAFLEQLKGEVTSETSKWKTIGLPTGNALQTQALIQLKKSYCEKKRCLDCRIGNVLLKDQLKCQPE